MTIKVTLFIQQPSAVSSPTAPIHRIGGWSESWYYPGTNLTNAIQATNGGGGIASPLCPGRAGLLGIGGVIVGQRFQQVNPLGISQSTNATFPSARQDAADTPQTALLIKIPGQGVKNIRRHILRGIPDIQVVEGEFSPNAGYLSQLQYYLGSSLQGFQFAGRDLTQPQNPILSGTAAGVFTTLNAPAVVPSQFVRILKAKESSGNLRGGRFAVTATSAGPNTITVANWPFGATVGGNYRLDQQVFPFVDNVNYSVGRIIIKKVGRPFVQYRGRRSRRR